MPPKNQRRSHTKSKNGCSQCKVRRIKCNEQQPTCSNCERRQISCDFSLPASEREARSSIGSDPTLSPSLSQGNGSKDRLPSPKQPRVDPFQLPNLVSTKRNTDLDVSDLELMHHYTSVVAPDIAERGEDTLPLWQSHIVTLAFKHDFLLRGILATAALHLSYLHPSMKEEYDFKASTHQGIALSSFQEALAHVSESNCHAIFAFGCVIILLAFASDKADEPRNLQTKVMNWIHLLRGANGVLQLHHDAIDHSFLAPLLEQMRHKENHAAHSIPDADHIMDLFRVCGAGQQDREMSQAYNLAIHDLLATFVHASVLRKRGEATVLSSFVWPINLSPRFIELLSEERPEAMVILAHYCVLIHWGEQDNTWFLRGWARDTMDTIKASVPESWHESLSWPDNVIQ